MAINYKSDTAKLQRDLIRLINKMPKVTATSTKRQLENVKEWVETYQADISKLVMQIWAVNGKALRIENGEKIAPPYLSAKKTTPKKKVAQKITDETPVNLKYRGFNIVTYKGKGGIWIAEAEHPNGTMFVVYSKPTEIKTAVEKIQEKIRKYLKK